MMNENFERQRGAVLIFTAIAIIALMLIAAMAVDIGFWYVRKNTLRQIAESASLAGAAFMPDRNNAFQHAHDLVEDNKIVYSDKCDASHSIMTDIEYPDNNSVSVKITDCKTPTFFSVFALGATVTTSGFAQATIGPPIPMGSPQNHLGTNTFFSSPENFWLATSGYCQPKENGDEFSTGWDFNVTATGVPAWSSDFPSGSTTTGRPVFTSCPDTPTVHGATGGSWVHQNAEYNSNDHVYKYLINVPQIPAGKKYHLLAYDPVAAGCDENLMNSMVYHYSPSVNTWTTTPGAHLSCRTTSPTCTSSSSSGNCYDPTLFNTTDGCGLGNYGSYSWWGSGTSCSYTGDKDYGSGYQWPDANYNDHPFAPVTTKFTLHSPGATAVAPIGPVVTGCDDTYTDGYYPGTTDVGRNVALLGPSWTGTNLAPVTLFAPGLSNAKTDWTELCSGGVVFDSTSTPGKYILEVNTKFQEPRSFGENFFGLLLEEDGDIASKTMTDCNQDVTATCPSIAAIGHLPLAIRPSVAGDALLHLARLDTSDNGRLITVKAFDPGEGMSQVSLETANFSTTDINSWGLKWRIADDGCSPKGSTAWASTTFPFDVSGVKPNLSSCDSAPSIGANPGKYNRQALEFQFRLPANFKPTNYNANPQVGGWIWIRYHPSSGVVSDRTTWSLKVLGTPVRVTK
jgi:hypothetical protein